MHGRWYSHKHCPMQPSLPDGGGPSNIAILKKTTGEKAPAVRLFRLAGLVAALSGRASGRVQRAGRCAAAAIIPRGSFGTCARALTVRMTTPPR